MPPRHHTLPAAQTSSARDAQKSFYCSLCSKGYSRMNDYEAHLSSYDHSHKQRLKDMKQMVRDPQASSRARKAEAKADAFLSIKMDSSNNVGAGTSGSGGFKKSGFKKGGFKSAFAPVDQDATTGDSTSANAAPASDAPLKPALASTSLAESDTDDEGYEVYDPRFPTE